MKKREDITDNDLYLLEILKNRIEQIEKKRKYYEEHKQEMHERFEYLWANDPDHPDIIAAASVKHGHILQNKEEIRRHFMEDYHYDFIDICKKDLQPLYYKNVHLLLLKWMNNEDLLVYALEGKNEYDRSK